MAKPEKVFHNGRCYASVFYNRHEKNGREYIIPSVKVNVKYKQNNEDKFGDSFSKTDLSDVVMSLCRAYNFLVEEEIKMKDIQ